MSKHSVTIRGLRVVTTCWSWAWSNRTSPSKWVGLGSPLATCSVYGDLTCSVHTVKNLCMFNCQCHLYLCNRGSYVRLAFVPNMLSSWNKDIIIIIIIIKDIYSDTLKCNILRRSFSLYSWADVVNFVKFHIGTPWRTINHKKRFDQTVSSDATVTSAVFKKVCVASEHLNVYRNKLASLIAKALANKKNSKESGKFCFQCIPTLALMHRRQVKMFNDLLQTNDVRFTCKI